MRVSVIIPTYNRASFIGETLESILGQSHQPAEVIVVDDGSTDETESVVRRFPAPVRYIRIENSGQGYARDVGVQMSASPYLAFCDDDDLWTGDKLALHARLFELAPDVQYSFSNFVLVRDGLWSKDSKLDSLPAGYFNAPRRELEPGLMVLDSVLFEKLLEYQPIFPSTLVMTRVFFESVGRWNAGLRCVPEDWEFHLRCVMRPPIGLVQAPVVGIRKHPSNFSADPLKTELGEIEVLNYVMQKHSAAQSYEAAIRRQIVIRAGNVVHAAFSIGRLDLVKHLLETVPPDRRDWKLRTKSAIARLPRPVARSLWRLSLVAGRGARVLR